MILILVNSDKVCLVDPDNYTELNKYRWFINNQGYAQANIKNKTVMMHRFVLKTGKGLHTHHKNRNRLDNRKENLSIVSCSDNQSLRNYRIGKSGYRGVKKIKRLFYAQIKVNQQNVNSKGFVHAFHAAVEAQNLLSIHRPDVDIDIVWRSR